MSDIRYQVEGWMDAKAIQQTNETYLVNKDVDSKVFNGIVMVDDGLFEETFVIMMNMVRDAFEDEQ